MPEAQIAKENKKLKAEIKAMNAQIADMEDIINAERREFDQLVHTLRTLARQKRFENKGDRLATFLKALREKLKKKFGASI